MYNRKSRISAILIIVTAVLLIGLMVMMPFLQYKQIEGDNGLGIAIGLIFIVGIGYPVIYVSSIPFVIVAIIFGIMMFKQKSRKKLIAYNVRMLITTCVLLPFIAGGLLIGSEMIINSTLGAFPIIYLVVVALAYVASLVMQIVAIVQLKKSPEEEAPTAVQEQ